MWFWLFPRKKEVNKSFKISSYFYFIGKWFIVNTFIIRFPWIESISNFRKFSWRSLSLNFVFDYSFSIFLHSLPNIAIILYVGSLKYLFSLVVNLFPVHAYLINIPMHSLKIYSLPLPWLEQGFSSIISSLKSRQSHVAYHFFSFFHSLYFLNLANAILCILSSTIKNPAIPTISYHWKILSILPHRVVVY